MVTIIFLIGIVFFLSGLLSIAGVTEVGVDFLSKSMIQGLPFLNTFQSNWVFLVIGLIVLAIAVGLSRRQ
jgi:uncharacterized membrane protein YczE